VDYIVVASEGTGTLGVLRVPLTARIGTPTIRPATNGSDPGLRGQVTAVVRDGWLAPRPDGAPEREPMLSSL